MGCEEVSGQEDYGQMSEAEAGLSYSSVFLLLVALFLVLDACRCLLVPEKCALLTVDLARGMRTASTWCLCPAHLQPAMGLGLGRAGPLTMHRVPLVGRLESRAINSVICVSSSCQQLELC